MTKYTYVYLYIYRLFNFYITLLKISNLFYHETLSKGIKLK